MSVMERNRDMQQQNKNKRSLAETLGNFAIRFRTAIRIIGFLVCVALFLLGAIFGISSQYGILSFSIGGSILAALIVSLLEGAVRINDGDATRQVLQQEQENLVEERNLLKAIRDDLDQGVTKFRD